MTDIQRYGLSTEGSLMPKPSGQYVLYADHVLARNEAYVKGGEDTRRPAYDGGYEEGKRYGLALRDVAWDEGVAYGIAQAVQRVEALFKNAHRLMSDGHYSYVVPDSADVIAAIKGESEPGYCPQCRDRTDFHYQDDDGRWFCRHCLCDYAIEGDNDGSV